MKMLKRFRNFLVGSIFIFLFLSAPRAQAEQIKIIFTGQSYATLYPCSCPHEPDGGVLRRATVIKKIRAESKNVIIVEAGSSLASGREDQNSQNYELDSRRTEAYLNSLKMMGYDALLVGGQEVAFGEEFLKRHEDLPFVSSNIKGFSKPYVIKEADGIKVGILGITDASILTRGAQGWQKPLTVLKDAILKLKKEGAGLIILLSSLRPEEDEELLKGASGVDVVINGSSSYGSVVLNEKKAPLFLSTWWQAKKVGILTLELTKGKIVKKSLQAIALSSDVPDDEALASLVPQCFQPGDCKKIKGMIGQCENAATAQAKCTYASQSMINVTVIRSRSCRTCHVEGVIEALQKVFGSITVTFLSDDDPKAIAAIKEFKMTMLPAYILDKKVEESEAFPIFKSSVDEGASGYMLKPGSTGVSYFLGRDIIAKRLDVFFDFSYPQLSQLFGVLKAFHEKHSDVFIQFHFLAIQDTDGTFISKGNASEVEEFKRDACIDALYPKELLDYLICRAYQKESSWWDECARQAGLDPLKIKERVFSKQGKEDFIERIRLTKELQVATGPTFVIDNKEVFGIVNVPTLEEFEHVVLGGSTQNTSQTKGSK